MTKQATPVKPVHKPMLIGNWHGKDTWRKIRSVFLGLLMVSFLFLILSLLLSFDSLALRILLALAIVALAGLWFYYQGTNAGQADAAFAEIMHVRAQEQKPVTEAERGRCYHPFKGFFAALAGTLPYVIIAVVFACLTVKEHYTLGVLPTWLTPFTRQSCIGDALSYYAQREGVTALMVLKIIVRAMTMPFMTVAVKLGADAVLLFERLSPLWVLIAPLCYGFGYRQGPKIREKINTGIQIGDQRKLKRAKRERKARQRTNAPERLI